MTATPRDAGARWAFAEGWALLATGLLALAFQLALPSTHVDEADYRALADVLQREAQPGDAVLLFPWWTERARLFVPEGLPVVGYLGSDEDALEHAPRIWVLAQPRLPGNQTDAFERAFSPRRTPVGPTRRFGNLALTLYTNGRYRPLAFSAETALERSVVSLEHADGTRTACAWNGRSHDCPGGRRVAVEWHEVHFRPLRCLRLEAPGGQDRLVVELPPGPAAEGLLLEAGYTGERGAYQPPGVSDSRVTLEIEGAAQTLLVPAGVERLHRLEHAAAVPAGARIRLWVEADNAHERQLCVTLDAFGSTP